MTQSGCFAGIPWDEEQLETIKGMQCPGIEDHVEEPHHPGSEDHASSGLDQPCHMTFTQLIRFRGTCCCFR